MQNEIITYTDQPYDSMWNHLKLLTYKSNVKQLLMGGLGSNRATVFNSDDINLDDKSSQIAYSISQAYEYFKAAESVTIITSPLLYFYGMLSLAKALIVANDPTLLLEDIKYHGLHTRAGKLRDTQWQNYTSKKNNWNMESEFAITNSGVFESLTNIAASFRFPPKSIFRFKDVLAISPEISEVYERYYGERSKTQKLYYIGTESFSGLSATPGTLIVCPQTVNSDEVRERVPELFENFDLDPNLFHGQSLPFVNKQGSASLPDSFGSYRPFIGGSYIVGGLIFTVDGVTSSHYLPPPLSDYISLFILSNCVRYKQEFWGRVVSGEQSGVLGLINLVISIARRRFPNFILDTLFGEHFEYWVAGAWR